MDANFIIIPRGGAPMITAEGFGTPRLGEVTGDPPPADESRRPQERILLDPGRSGNSGRRAPSRLPPGSHLPATESPMQTTSFPEVAAADKKTAHELPHTENQERNPALCRSEETPGEVAFRHGIPRSRIRAAARAER